jgi:Domain of unknown function (DUF4396)
LDQNRGLVGRRKNRWQDAGVIPDWLHALSIVSLVLGFACAVIIIVDEFQHPQRMWIMNVVWPVTALFGVAITLWGYFTYGRLAMHDAVDTAQANGGSPPSETETPFPVMVGKGAAHCGSGCTLGDICAEWLAFAFPVLAVAFGYQTIFSEKIFAVWVLDYIFAYAFGIVFQYFTIAPMRSLTFWPGIWAAIKADTLSLTAWQVGMYGFMAFANLWLFRQVIGVRLEVNTVEFWFMMQIAMLCGFATAYPVNWWLLRIGVKEKM